MHCTSSRASSLSGVTSRVSSYLAPPLAACRGGGRCSCWVPCSCRRGPTRASGRKREASGEPHCCTPDRESDATAPKTARISAGCVEGVTREPCPCGARHAAPTPHPPRTLHAPCPMHTISIIGMGTADPQRTATTEWPPHQAPVRHQHNDARPTTPPARALLTSHGGRGGGGGSSSTNDERCCVATAIDTPSPCPATPAIAEVIGSSTLAVFISVRPASWSSSPSRALPR